MRQLGTGNCEPLIAPTAIDLLPVGGQVNVDVTFAAGCEFIGWEASVDGCDTMPPGESFLSLRGADQEGKLALVGNGSLTLVVDPYEIGQLPDGVVGGGLIPAREGSLIIDVATQDVPVIQEAPLFDHFDDSMSPPPDL